MKIADLQALLAQEAEELRHLAAQLTEAEFANQPQGRWSVGDTMQHLFLSARPVARLLAGPRAIMTQWGLAGRPSRSISDIGELYRQALSKGIKAPANLSPRPDDVPADKATVRTRLTDTYLTLAEQLATWTEEELDQYQMPHPALGLLSVREMLYFVRIHTQHHIAVLAAY
ncbi:DinB family protein [Fibrella arboris]|uniref:DinB family protein n=1 Tax=Fibrella arboris TaxID=3242486 RepID=UPI003521BEA0